MKFLNACALGGALLCTALLASNAMSAAQEGSPCCTKPTGEPGNEPGDTTTRTSCSTTENDTAECPSQTGATVNTQSVDFISGLSTKISIQRSGFSRFSNGGNSRKTAANDLVLGGGASADSELTGKLSPFMVLDRSESDRRATAAGLAYEQELNAVIIGADYRVSDTLIAGATLNYLKSDTDFANNRGGSETDNYVAGLHVSHYRGNLYVDGLLTFGRMEIDVERIDGVGNRYDGETEGKFHSAEIATGINARYQAWGFTPSVRLLHLRGSLGGYGEVDRNNGGLANNFRRQHFESLNARAAMQVDYAWLVNWGVLIPSLYFAYHHEYIGAETARSTTAFGTLIQKTDDPARNYRVGRFNLAAQFRHGLSGFLSYERLIDHQYIDRDTFTLGLRYEM